MAVDSTLGGDLTTVGQVVRKAQLQTALDELQTQIDNIEVGGGAVDSVNGQTGVVVLDPDDLDDTSTTNKFTTAGDISKLSGIESNATADQSDAEIKTAYENNADTNAFDDAAVSKLAGIEASADVTDETNVVSSLNGATLTSVSPASDDEVLVQDTSDSGNLKTVTYSDITGASAYTNDTIYFVDPVDGNDSNDGLTPSNAKATIQDAVDDLDTALGSSAGEGIIYLLPGRHDVGTGVDIPQYISVNMIGSYWNRRVIGSATDAPSSVVFSSEATSPTYLIRRGVPGSESSNADGGGYDNIVFEMDGENLEYAVHAYNWNRGYVRRCNAYHLDDANFPDTYFLNFRVNPDYGGADGSWLLMYDNICTGTGLVEVGYQSGSIANSNEHRLHHNIVFGHSSRTVGLITIRRAIACEVFSNTVEGGTIGIELGRTTNDDFGRSHWVAFNSGEAIGSHIQLISQVACTIIPGGTRIPTKGTDKLVDIQSGGGNVILTPSHNNNHYGPSEATITDATGNSFILGGDGWGIQAPGLPTSDPGIAGRIWNNNNVLTVSTGA